MRDACFADNGSNQFFIQDVLRIQAWHPIPCCYKTYTYSGTVWKLYSREEAGNIVRFFHCDPDFWRNLLSRCSVQKYKLSDHWQIVCHFTSTVYLSNTIINWHLSLGKNKIEAKNVKFRTSTLKTSELRSVTSPYWPKLPRSRSIPRLRCTFCETASPLT